MPADAIRNFLKLESASGILLIAAMILAILADNTALAPLYDSLLTLPFTIALGDAALSKPLLLWINDGLMAIFFLLVGLEIKREILEGELSSREQLTLPLLAAAGGMALPALIYAGLNADNAGALAGWAIPAATDIAFALGIMSLLGSRVPVALKVMLTAIAIIDDLGAIVIIAIFYTADLSLWSLLLAALALLGLFLLNRRGVRAIAPYLLVGIVLWLFVLKSGVHATLAGVAVGLAVPLKARPGDDGRSPLKTLEDNLHPWVAYAILPLFAFANAGVPLVGIAVADFMRPVTTGIAAGLFVGKQLGILGAVWLGTLMGFCRLPAGVTWRQVHGVALLAGIGFTMSLFIGTLAFEDPALAGQVRLGVLGGSLFSGVFGYLALRAALSRQQ